MPYDSALINLSLKQNANNQFTLLGCLGCRQEHVYYDDYYYLWTQERRHYNICNHLCVHTVGHFSPNTAIYLCGLA